MTDRPDAPPGVHLHLHRLVQPVVMGLLTVQLLLVAGDIVFNVVDIVDDRSIRRIFNPAREESLPTWFASVQALLVAALAGCHALLDRARGRPPLGWLGVAAFFTYISADDAAEIHERVGSALERATDVGTLPTYAWQVFIAPILAILLLASAAKAWRSIPAPTRWWLVVALGCFGLSQGLDFVEGLDGMEAALTDLAARWGVRDYVVTHTPRLIEEWLEMLGTATFAGVLLSGLAANSGGTTITIDDHRSEDPGVS